jgi:hypothetical protein
MRSIPDCTDKGFLGWDGIIKSMENKEKILLQKRDFELGSFDDELRVDSLCRDLMLKFYRSLLDDRLPPAEATALASGADYFIRDFVIDKKQLNILAENPGLVRQFAGNWYIVNTLEPNLQELCGYLGGILEFYRFLCNNGSISAKYFDIVAKECSDVAYYEARIDSFWAIQGDGYLAWERECSLKADKAALSVEGH